MWVVSERVHEARSEGFRLPSDDPLYDRETEEALLSSMMLSTQAIADAVQVGITPADFGSPELRAVAGAIFDTYNEVGAADERLVIHRLRGRHELELAGGELKLIELATMTPVPAVSRAGHYANIVRELAMRREVVFRSSDVARAAREYGDLGETIDQLVRVHSSRPDMRQRVLAGSAVLNVPSVADAALWGSGDRCAWAQGESLILVSATGLGKSLLLGQLAKARMGLMPYVLEFPVRPGGRVLYLAMDRPHQILRGLARPGVLGEVDPAVLDERLAIWPGPPPRLVTEDTHVLAELARTHGADTLIIDSLKDISAGLNTDEHGIAINTALQRVLAIGVEVAIGHHHVKNGDPKTLDAVYGSTFITAGAGSVFGLWASDETTDQENPRVRVAHLKTPAAGFAVDEISHDVFAGTSVIVKGMPDVLACVREAGCLTAEQFAVRMTPAATPSDHYVRKARNMLNREVAAGRLRRVAGSRRPGGGQDPDLYCLPPADGDGA